MHSFHPHTLNQLYIPSPDSHKGQNGKLLLIGGSHLFHAASLWALTIASRVVDMVFYASVPENNHIVQHAKQEFRNGIVIRREDIDDYAKEADCILIGPGMVRTEKSEKYDVKNMNPEDKTIHNSSFILHNLRDLDQIEDEGLQTRYITQYILQKYPEKKFVLDAGALQMMEPEWLQPVKHVILTPHPQEFERLFGVPPTPELVSELSQRLGCVIVLKGKEDIVCGPDECVQIHGGNAGMTKGGTGDVLAGLIGALACNNDMYLSACAGSFFNKKAGESLSKRMGLYFNSSDLALEIPVVIYKELKNMHEHVS
jgi:ADP-dependent NAD(P)H-hydrate dehydratase / NAD(P)H-hydrate epimerase